MKKNFIEVQSPDKRGQVTLPNLIYLSNIKGKFAKRFQGCWPISVKVTCHDKI